MGQFKLSLPYSDRSTLYWGQETSETGEVSAIKSNRAARLLSGLLPIQAIENPVMIPAIHADPLPKAGPN